MTAATPMTLTAPIAQQTAGKIVIDFLFLDLTSCERCVGTDENLSAALQATRQVLEASGRQVEVRKHHVRTEQDARRLRFVSSPTLRLNGKDLAVELTETSCGSEACADGCGAHIDCRVWTHQGRQYTQAPVPMIVDAVLREIYTDQQPTEQDTEPAAPYEVPENLQRFFRAKHQVTGTAPAGAATVAGVEDGQQAGCCSAAHADTCCDPAEKASCCESSATAGDCGCR